MVNPMTKQFPLYRKGARAVCLLACILLMLVASGCTQPASQQQKTPAAVNATRTDSSHIMITYPGSTETSTLLELEVTVTDSKGTIKTQSAGSKLATTPLKFGATIPFTGTFDGNDHVQVTGYFLDGSRKTMLDATI
jgi:hypothetical protein